MTFNDDLAALHASLRRLGEAILAGAPLLAWLWRTAMRFTIWYLDAFTRLPHVLPEAMLRLAEWLLRHPVLMVVSALVVLALDTLLLVYPLIGLAILLGALAGCFIGLLLATYL